MPRPAPQLEDDIIPAANWMSHVHRMVLQANTQKRDWYMIEFSRLGFIGKTFPAAALDEMVDFFTANYALLPVDILLARVCVAMSPACKGGLVTRPRPILVQLVRRRPNQHFMSDQALFQHAGYYSSLAGKVQTLTDTTFADGKDDDEEQDVREYFTDHVEFGGQDFGQRRPWFI
jgi:hypothetical protein